MKLFYIATIRLPTERAHITQNKRARKVPLQTSAKRQESTGLPVEE